FLTEHFNVRPDSVIHHNISSSEAFLKMALAGVAYCLITRLQITDELENCELIDIKPGFLMSYRIYWHHWQLETGVLQEISQAIVGYAQQHLPQ
ncbi:MAG: ArgP/LysG family DNA-binding transcriptional regulator, partial [Pseudomonadota bacterium]